MTTFATLAEAISDTALAFGFEHNGARWTFVIRDTTKLGTFTRVDVFEDAEPAGVGYLPDHDLSCPMEDGPLFDGSHNTPLGGKSIESDESLTRWGEKLWYAWNKLAPAYRKMRAAR